MHGGKTPVKHGLYSKYGRKLGRDTEYFLEAGDVQDLRQEIAVLRSILADSLEKENGKTALAVQDRLTDAITAQGRILERLEKKNIITLDQLKAVLAQVKAIIMGEVKDDAQRERIADRLEELVLPVTG